MNFADQVALWKERATLSNRATRKVAATRDMYRRKFEEGEAEILRLNKLVKKLGGKP